MVRKTLRWLLTLLALAGVIAGAGVWYAWVQGDEYARQELRRRLAEIGPSCHLEIGKVRFDWDRSVYVYDFAVRPKGQDVPPTFAAPEAVLQIDRERFLNDQVVDVQVIRLIRPRLDVTRRADGTWSVEDLKPFRLDEKIAVPEWQIEDATIRFRLEQAGAEPVVLTLRDADLRLVPSGRKQLLIRGLTGDVADAGPLRVSGRLDLERGTWSLKGSVTGLDTSGDIAAFLLRSSAELRDQVAALSRKLRDAEESLLADDEPEVAPNVVPVRTVSRSRETPPAGVALGPGDAPEPAEDAPGDLTGLGIDALLDLTFEVSQAEGRPTPDYRVQVECRDGTVENPLLPFPLRHLRGRLFCDNSNFELTSFQADGGGTSLRVDAGFRRGEAAATGSVSVAVTNLVVSESYPGRLPAAAEKFLEVVRPSGPVDLVGTFDRDAAGTWTAREFELTAKGAAARPEPFPYPIREVAGTVRKTGPGRFEAAMTGKAGARPVRLIAQVAEAAGGAEVAVRIDAVGVPLDETFREACKPETRAVLQELGLEGVADAEVHLYRPAGPGRKYGWWFKARVTDGELEYARFPYRLSELTGEVTFNSEDDTLRIRDAVGRHGAAVVRGGGSFRKPPEVGPDGTSPIGDAPPGLRLELTAEQVGLGDDLRAALPDSLRRLWEELNLDGSAGFDVTVAWVPGHPPDVALPRFDVSDGVLNPRDFPYLLHTISAKASYTPPRVEVVAGRRQLAPARVAIREFVGWHDGGVRVEARGAGVTLSPDGAWVLSLPRLDVEDLPLGSEFRRAAPDGLRRVIESLDPRGRFDLVGWLELRSTGVPRGPVAATWDLTGRLADASIKPGVQVTHASGDVRCAGSAGPGGVDLTGDVELDSAVVFGQRLENVRGPFRVKDGRVVLGSEAALRGGPDGSAERAVPVEQRLTATYLEPGLLTLDAVVLPDAGPRYEGRVTLTGGSLERYAASQTGGGTGKLSGSMTGWADFQGQGSSPAGVVGRGRLVINPAELYELPVVMQTFNALFPVPPDNTAFREARLDFTIHDGGFVFDRREGGSIVLTGDALRLVGGGFVGFDGRLDLELYTTLPGNPVGAVSAVPIVGRAVSQIVGGVVQAAATGWVSVLVRGTADNPDVRQVPLKVVPDGIRQMLESLGPPRMRTATGPGARR